MDKQNQRLWFLRQGAYQANQKPTQGQVLQYNRAGVTQITLTGLDGGAGQSGSLLLQGALSHSPGVPFMQLSQKAQPRLGEGEGRGRGGGGGGGGGAPCCLVLWVSRSFIVLSSVRSLALFLLSLPPPPPSLPPPSPHLSLALPIQIGRAHV